MCVFFGSDYTPYVLDGEDQVVGCRAVTFLWSGLWDNLHCVSTKEYAQIMKRPMCALLGGCKVVMGLHDLRHMILHDLFDLQTC